MIDDGDEGDEDDDKTLVGHARWPLQFWPAGSPAVGECGLLCSCRCLSKAVLQQQQETSSLPAPSKHPLLSITLCSCHPQRRCNMPNSPQASEPGRV